MIKRTAGQIASLCGAAQKGGSRELLLTGIMTDSRAVGSGELFVPIVGENFDGHDFAQAAAAAGAKAMLWQRGKEMPEDLVAAGMPFLLVKDTLAALQKLAAGYRSELMTRIVAITGSNGKTTTKDMTAALLSTQYRVLKTKGNLNNEIGLPLTLLSMDEDTEVAVLEMGMSGFGEIALLTDIAQPDVAIVTNIGESHMEHLGSRAGIAKAKLEIKGGLAEGGVLLYNGDEPLLAAELERLGPPEGVQLRTFGLGSGNLWTAADIELDAAGSSFMVLQGGVPSSVGTVRVPVPGRHNISNALAAIAAARIFGVPASAIASGFASLKLTSMRLEKVEAFNGAAMLNDAYNASPTSTRAAIDLVAGLSGYSRRWLVLGDMLELGPDEAAMHGEVGAYIASGKAEALLTYGPLSEHTHRAALQSLPEAASEGLVRHFDSKDELAAWLRERLLPQDLVLVKGSRGMAMEQIVQALTEEG